MLWKGRVNNILKHRHNCAVINHSDIVDASLSELERSIVNYFRNVNFVVNIVTEIADAYLHVSGIIKIYEAWKER